MEPRRWTNVRQPQTLQIAVFLLYANAVLLVFSMFRGVASPLLFVAAVAGSVAAGFGIANERRWGYVLGIAMALFPFLLRLVFFGLRGLLSTDLISLMFEVALVALLVHPLSRDYQRIWFK